MLSEEQVTPRARVDELLRVDLPNGEILLHDLKSHKAHSLNRTASLVWGHCDGQQSVADLSRLLQQELNLPEDEAVVWLTLDGLEKAHLLQERLSRPPEAIGLSRRQVMRKLGMVGGLSLLLPVVTSIMAPEPAEAASGKKPKKPE